MDGLEVLRNIKADERLRSIQVVVLTSSREERDLVESYKLGVNAYVVKPVDFGEFMNAVEKLGVFWAIINEPPPVRSKRGRRRMKGRLRILHLEDNPNDAELVGATLADAGIDAEIRLVATRDDFTTALGKGGIDLILADLALPAFDGMTALAIIREITPTFPSSSYPENWVKKRPSNP